MSSVAVTGGPTNPEAGMTLADLRAFLNQCEFIGADENISVQVAVKDNLLLTTSIVVESFRVVPAKKHTGACRCTGIASDANNVGDKKTSRPRTASGITFDGRSDR